MRPIRLLLMIAITWVVASGFASAQVRKCTAADGKVTYSDFVCAGASAENGVKVNQNTIDASGLREQARQTRQENEVAEAMQQRSGQCKFSSYVYGDAKGKTLAAAAKEECLRNIAAQVTGQQTSMDAYNMWKDHSTQKDANRQSAITRAANAANTQAAVTANQNAINGLSNQIQNKTYTCKRDFSGTALECK